jgi:hypothetical protein
MRKLVSLVIAVMALAIIPAVASAAPPVSGAVFTTNSTCTQVNGNIYSAKTDVYVDGGPKGQQAGLPDGNYYVQVTDPSGATVLGNSIGMGDQTPYHVVNGVVDGCLQLSLIVGQAGVPGYADTPNAGGEYKVWISNDPTFVNNSTKTDNFKVNATEPPPPPNPPHLNVVKFYDANTNGVQDSGRAVLASAHPRRRDQ